MIFLSINSCTKVKIITFNSYNNVLRLTAKTILVWLNFSSGAYSNIIVVTKEIKIFYFSYLSYIMNSLSNVSDSTDPLEN